jgi:hypothetical protein
MSKATKKVEIQIPATEAECTARLLELDKALTAARPLAARLLEMQKALETVEQFQAEYDAIRTAMPDVKRGDFERAAASVTIREVFRQRGEVHPLADVYVTGTKNGVEFTDTVRNVPRFVLAAITPDMVPAGFMNTFGTAAPADVIAAVDRFALSKNRGYVVGQGAA